MSLDVHLEDENGNDLYWRNITHNLTTMASTAGLYECLWRPEELERRLDKKEEYAQEQND